MTILSLSEHLESISSIDLFSVQFHHWGCLDLAKLIEAFYLLFTYYVNESSSGKAGQGAFAIHPDLKQLFCELLPENLPYNSCPPPAEIVDYLKMSEEREKSVNMMAIREKADLFSPTSYPYTSTRTGLSHSAACSIGLSSQDLLHEAMVASHSSGLPPAHSFHHHSSSFNYSTGVNTTYGDHNQHTTFSFDRSLDEFGLTNLTRYPVPLLGRARR